MKQLFAHKPVLATAEMKVVEVPGSKIACTFYNTIFLGADLSEKEREQILSHELVHVKQKHTLDLLFFEILRIIFWFNPLVYIYQSRISALHEYLADAGVVKNVKKQDYFQQLLNSAFNTEDISFVNQFFNHSIIKKRIVMLQKNKSKSVLKLKYLLILPLLGIMLTYVACSSTQKVRDEQSAPVTSVEVEEVDKDNLEEGELAIPFAVVEQAPIFPGCEDVETPEQQKDCMSMGINAWVNKRFNTSLGKELGLKGVNRVYVQFKVSPEGKISSVRSRAPHPALAEEAERVVKSIPDMEPAIHDGERVAVLYSLPISFMVPEKTSEEGDSDN